MAEGDDTSIDYLPDSPVVQMLVVPDDAMAEARQAINELLPKRKAADDEGDEEGVEGPEKVLGISGTGCRRTTRRDIHCGDED